MAVGRLSFEDKGISGQPRKFKKPSKVSCATVIIILVSSLIFGFLGGVVSIYALSGRAGLEESKLGLDIGKKTYKVTEESAAIDAVKKVSPSVVSITAISTIEDIFGSSQTQQSLGSGFIITSDGLILTNRHVVSNPSAEYTVFTSDGKGHKAQIKATDPFNDLAIIKITASGLTPVELGDSDELQIAQHVIAIGNALGFQNTVTIGVVSAKERTIQAGDTSGGTQETLEGLLQTDAAINQGNSGGPLVNIDGQVVGINTAVAEKSMAEGIGFAIPINVAKSAIESYKKHGRIVRPLIGVRYISLTKEIAEEYDLSVENGALVYSGEARQPAVLSGSPADKAGLKEGDIITAINEEKIDGNHSLSRLIQQYQPGDEIEITYLRDGGENKVKLTLTEYKE